MSRIRFFRVLSILVVVTLLVAASASAASRPARFAGTWLAQIFVPPNSLLGNTEVVVMPELVTIGRGGGVVVTPSSVYTPLPFSDGLTVTLMSSGQASWKVSGKRWRTTNWRFMSDPTSGQLLAFCKIHVEAEMVNRRRMEGQGLVEFLNPDLTPLTLEGEPVVLLADVIFERLPVERMPAIP